MNYIAQLNRIGIDTSISGGENDILILCPFHDETTASCEVHKTKGIFHCFTCKEKGNFTKLTAQILGVSYNEAKRRLLDDETVEDLLSELENVELETSKTQKYFSIKSFHEKYMPAWDNKIAKKYLIGRGVSKDSATLFDLRYGKFGVMDHRIVIPIYTVDGKLINYVGRAVDSRKPKTRKVQSNRETIHGLFELLVKKDKWYVDPTKKFPYAILVEGSFDMFSLRDRGYISISNEGTTVLTPQQLVLIRRYFEKLIIMFDPDKAGIKARNLVSQKVKKYLPCVYVKLPIGKDPDELSDEELKHILQGVI